MPLPDPHTLLDFWFGDSRTQAAAIPERMSFWFQPSSSDDAAVAERFADALALASGGHLTRWLANSDSRLALILTLDQAPRVIHRRRAEAFAHDGQALATALAGIKAGVDEQLGLAERAFFYMPLQHAEDPLVQRLSVARYQALVEAFPDHADIARSFLGHAREHAEIIERFGRYPHRNEVLERESTNEERAFLESGPRYGQ
ncbi:DUF924 domain-containing protein [Wenzhouxiangella sp. XN201]|uniref:DUF924 family protein n=1 Tax=Wenzhouxiangella sp. XN201 TaxID=2710755 RepID=UPI0013C97023|nr:DUF924 family protein [Wenzhouxiangella sp. XN201]NEZ04876.1 DUF924 domain-containing protein [Wenzhouxiangella sp. XN201]